MCSVVSDAIPPGICAVSADVVQQCVHVYEGCVQSARPCAHMYEGCVQHVDLCESAHESCQCKSAHESCQSNMYESAHESCTNVINDGAHESSQNWNKYSHSKSNYYTVALHMHKRLIVLIKHGTSFN